MRGKAEGERGKVRRGTWGGGRRTAHRPCRDIVRKSLKQVRVMGLDDHASHAARHLWFSARFPIPGSGCSLPTSHCTSPLLTAHCSLLTAHCSPLPASRFPLPASRFPLPVSRFPLSAFRFPLPAPRFPLPASRFPLPARHCSLLTLSRVEGPQEELEALFFPWFLDGITRLLGMAASFRCGKKIDRERRTTSFVRARNGQLLPLATEMGRRRTCQLARRMLQVKVERRGAARKRAGPDAGLKAAVRV